jgi:hypothetical protein
MARRRNYAFIRRDIPNWADLAGAGWDTPLIRYDDPRLGEMAAQLKAMGREFGIWGDPRQGQSPEDYAKMMYETARRYGTNIVSPDLEFPAKGYEGSPGWQYNEQLARAWQSLMPDMETVVSVMPNQRDFNYEAWKGIADMWLPQAYGADPRKDIFDPQQIVQTLIDRGVDPSLIMPVLGAGHKTDAYKRAYSLYTADDFQGGALPRAYVDEDGNVVSQSGNMERLPDRLNPRAIEYANMRLAQLRALGYDYEELEDPTATWRRASEGVAAAAREAGYDNPRDWLRGGPAATRPSVMDADRPQRGRLATGPKIVQRKVVKPAAKVARRGPVKGEHGGGYRPPRLTPQYLKKIKKRIVKGGRSTLYRKK